MRMLKSFLVGTALFASACAQKSYGELFRLADSNYEALMQPYETARGTLRSVSPELGVRCYISLAKGGHVTEVAYLVTGHDIILDILADSDDKREAFTFYKGSPFSCRSFALDNNRSPVGQITEYDTSECKQRAKPHMDNFVSALKEYEASRRR